MKADYKATQAAMRAACDKAAEMPGLEGVRLRELLCDVALGITALGEALEQSTQLDTISPPALDSAEASER